MNGIVILRDDAVIIKRTGLVAQLTVGHGEKHIPLRSITAIQFKPAGVWFGFIQFTIPGGIEHRSKFGSQWNTSKDDENTVWFSARKGAEFERLRKAIQSRIGK